MTEIHKYYDEISYDAFEGRLRPYRTEAEKLWIAIGDPPRTPQPSKRKATEGGRITKSKKARVKATTKEENLDATKQSGEA